MAISRTETCCMRSEGISRITLFEIAPDSLIGGDLRGLEIWIVEVY